MKKQNTLAWIKLSSSLDSIPERLVVVEGYYKSIVAPLGGAIGGGGEYIHGRC